MIFNIGRLGTGLCPADSDMFLIHKFHLWFHAGVAQWLDIALYKALQRIKKAVDIDHLVPVDSTVKYSSSAVDTLAIFYQVQYLWFEVEGRGVKMHHQDMGYVSACVNIITTRQYTGSIPFSWDMMLCHWVIGSQSFEEMYCPHFQVSKCQRRILVEHFDTCRWGQHVTPKGHDPITQWYNVLYQDNGISAPSQQNTQNSQLLGKSRVVILFSIYIETAFNSYHLTWKYVHFIIFVQYLSSFTAL